MDFFCNVQPNRRTGSAGNRTATDFFADTMHTIGYELDTTPFDCLDYRVNRVGLSREKERYEVYVSPYSLGVDVSAELVVASTVGELEELTCEGHILLMKDELCAEQLMPKNFVFYNPEHHQNIITLLEERQPAAIITATDRNPEQAGALYPYPIFVDGDFDISSVYCRMQVGEALATLQGESLHLLIDARRIKSSASNVIARLNPGASKKVVITAHIDAYEDSPGASDNASGTNVLLLAAEMLANYNGAHSIEFVAFNGEDHYSVGGQMDYLRRYGAEFPAIDLLVNIDGVGYKDGSSAYSTYGCSEEIERKIVNTFQRFEGLACGPQWYSGDHMIFVQKQVPSLAFTSEKAMEMLALFVHTGGDTPAVIDHHKVVEVAESVAALVKSLSGEVL
jgi:aminopeptidase YwaD